MVFGETDRRTVGWEISFPDGKSLKTTATAANKAGTGPFEDPIGAAAAAARQIMASLPPPGFHVRPSSRGREVEEGGTETPTHLCHRGSPLGPVSVADLTDVPMAVIRGHGSPAHPQPRFKKLRAVATLALAPPQISTAAGGSAFGSDAWQRGGNKDGGRIVKNRLRSDGAALLFVSATSTIAGPKRNQTTAELRRTQSKLGNWELEPERHSTRLD